MALKMASGALQRDGLLPEVASPLDTLFVRVRVTVRVMVTVAVTVRAQVWVRGDMALDTLFVRVRVLVAARVSVSIRLRVMHRFRSRLGQG